jgi:hypothetical protein
MRGSGAAHATIGLAVALPLSLALMNPLAAQPRGSIAPRPSQSVSTSDQLAPSQMNQPIPPAVAEPPSASHFTAHASATAEPRAATGRPLLPSGSHTVIACGGGPFAQDSGMLSLAMTFGDSNVTFTHEKVQDSDVGATIVFPKDPRRRLEVWWQNPNRTGLFLIDIAGKSIWTGPEGLHLGLTLPELEKRNHKPFKLKGFDKDGVAAVSDWDGGALAALPGGCKASVSFRADAKTAKDAASAIAADREFSSADSAVRAAKLSVSEILIGY